MKVLDGSAGSATSFLLLLDPTSPLRDPRLINEAGRLLREADDAHGAVSISVPSFNPLWVGVELGSNDRIRRHPSTPQVFARRQDVPGYWRINGNFYLWRNDFARRMERDWLDRGALIGVEIPEILSHSIDTLNDVRLVEALVTSNVVHVPWLGDRYGR